MVTSTRHFEEWDDPSPFSYVPRSNIDPVEVNHVPPRHPQELTRGDGNGGVLLVLLVVLNFLNMHRRTISAFAYGAFTPECHLVSDEGCFAEMTQNTDCGVP